MHSEDIKTFADETERSRDSSKVTQKTFMHESVPFFQTLDTVDALKMSFTIPEKGDSALSSLFNCLWKSHVIL